MFQEKKERIFSNTPTGLICPAASFTSSLPASLLYPFEFGSNLDKPDGKQTLCAGWPKKAPEKESSERKKLQCLTSWIQGQGPFARGEGMCSWGHLHQQAAKAEASRGLREA